MGSIVAVEKVDKVTGKKSVRYRAFIRRQGFASKSATFDNRTDAREWLRNNEGDDKLARPGEGRTFADLVNDFMRAPPMRGTRWHVPSQVDFWRDEFGRLKVGEISRADINQALAALQNQKARRRTIDGTIHETDRLLTPGTINRYRATLASIFNYAVAREILAVSPLKVGGVPKLKESRGRRRILTADEERRLYEAAEASTWPMMPLFLRLLFTTAARKSEVLRLRWQDVSLDECVAMLPTTKNGEPRALPLVADVREALAAAQKVKPLGSDFVFFDPRHPKRPKAVDGLWRAVRERAGLFNDRADPMDRVVLHSTRHTGATRLVKGGANLAQVAAVTGHKTLDQLRRYSHLATADAVELAERLLSGSGAGEKKSNTAA
jgi:integrase